jgi:DNA-nicking Smr family endonuclease
LPELLPGVTAGVDKRTAQRLGRGQLAIEARLDLHGLTQDEAHAKLAGFIRRSVGAGKRCVLIITGKGFKPTGETGVLRQAVPRWLNEPGMRRDIVALRHAQLKDGGEGALYVLLRRDRAVPSSAKDAPAPKRLTRKRKRAEP